ncbi:hypothetical protein ETB97_012174 [Aspergillus alliaceus]|uniref:Uncharacterized protein n=1 Tax=Petromyces alliaceus TaxID=209559 RepID=A0A8H6A3F9_PETAA|nr:hypothetical protein ETB97_012174 [Aspergillus burnettii]
MGINDFGSAEVRLLRLFVVNSRSSDKRHHSMAHEKGSTTTAYLPTACRLDDLVRLLEMPHHGLPLPGSPFQLYLLKDNKALVANGGELSFVDESTTELHDQYFIVDEERKDNGTSTFKIKTGKTGEDPDARLANPLHRSQLFALSHHEQNFTAASPIRLQFQDGQVDSWGESYW